MGIVDQVKGLFSQKNVQQARGIADQARNKVRGAGPDAARRALDKTPLKDNATAQRVAHQADDMARNVAGTDKATPSGTDRLGDAQHHAQQAAGQAEDSAKDASQSAANAAEDVAGNAGESARKP